MESKEEEEETEAVISTLKLPLLSIPAISMSQGSPEHSGMVTPPLHSTTASVPFRWEEQPGKPRPCTALITLSQSHRYHQDPHTTTSIIKDLELPPRLQLFSDPKMTKTPSPTTVLDGPYLPALFQSSSFRFTTRRTTRGRHGSFGSSCGSPERGQFGNSVVPSSKKSMLDEGKGRRSSVVVGGRGILGPWRRKSSSLQTHKRAKSEVGGGSFVFSSPVDLAGFGVDDLESGVGGGAKAKKVLRNTRRNGSFSSLSQVRSPFWATIYEGFKQALPWKTANSKKDGLPI